LLVGLEALRFGFSKLDLCSSDGPSISHTSPLLSPVLQLLDATSHISFFHPCIGAWLSRTGPWISCIGVWMSCSGTLLHSANPGCCCVLDFFAAYLSMFFFFLCYLGYCLILRETFVFEFVLVPFFFVIPNSDFNSAFIALAFFWWLLLFSSVGTNRFVLICTSQCDAPFIFIQNGITIVV
jgi:hypothetical protein